MSTTRRESAGRWKSSNTIINRDTKTATYKLALLRACCDIAQRENGLVHWTADGRAAIPADLVAEKWIEYYWPLVSSPKFLAQTQGETPVSKKPVAFRRDLSDFIASYAGSGDRNAYIDDRDAGSLSPRLLSSRSKLITRVRNTIIKGPVYYSGGGASNDKRFRMTNRPAQF